MVQKLLHDKLGLGALIILTVVIVMGIFAPFFSLHDPLAQDIMMKFSSASTTYPLGTDHLGRCVYSRLVYGIRTTIFLSVLTMICTIGIGVFVGVISGYYQGKLDELIMRFCDIMLSFPS